MSQDYVNSKALEAIDSAGDNRKEAAQLLRVWAETDEELKKALIKPFLLNICSLAIQRVLSETTESSKRRIPDQTSLLSAIASHQTLTMSSTRQPQSPPPRSSLRHQQAMATLAASFKKN
tara:strand:- start:4728 stop:5087 length:360 start_codon:yes stop_codon:yes gene_type:complete